MFDGTGLTGQTAAFYCANNIKFINAVSNFKRLVNNHFQNRTAKILVDGFIVNCDITFKVEKYLKRCLDSVLSQTFCEWEAICVDDGSPDNCGAILDEYAEKDNRIGFQLLGK